MQGGRNQNQDQVVIAVAAAAGALLGGALAGPAGAAGGAAIAVGLVQAGQQREEPQPRPEEDRDGTVAPIYLQLAYRATEAGIIKSIPKNKPLDRDSCKKLYKACKYMRKISDLGDSDQLVGPIDDEYAFCVVTLKVNEDIPGLDSGANPLQRLDAFLKLAGKAEIVEEKKIIVEEEVIASPEIVSTSSSRSISLEGKGFYKIA